LIFEHRDIVVGNSLDAVVFAFNNGYPIYFAHSERPFRFDYLDPDIDLSCLKMPTCNKSLTTFNGEKPVGISQEALWERLLFIMSIVGHAPLSDMCNSIRHDDSKITCFNEYSKIAEVRYEKMYNFKRDDKNSKLLCRDWVAFNSGGKHDVDLIETSDDFVNQIWFYQSDRICGNTMVKDACAVSVIDDEAIEDFEYGQTMVRFKVVKEMKDRGMKGLLSSYGPNGNPKHYDFKTSIISRSIAPIGPVECYDQHGNFVNVPNFKKMLQRLDKNCYRYRKILRHL